VSSVAKILVVDDEDSGRYAKVQILRRAGFNVLEASSGSECLSLVDSEKPDLLVLDVNLPDINGMEVARRLRASTTGPPAIQILQISNTATSSADQVRGLEHGADVYLTEPVDATVIVATAQALLRVRRAETALASALVNERREREHAEQANQLKDEFIATLSHELRTPLNALMGWIWQLRHAKLDPDAQSQALDSLERNARMHAQLINDLLDVSRASKGKLQLEMRLIDLQVVVRNAAEAVRGAIDRKRLELATRLEPAMVAGDQSRLQQVLMNLLTNAVQFTPEGGRITVRLRVEGGEVVLEVEDSGSGIEPAFLPHVFDQFRQGEGGLSRKHGGLGIGLAVVRQLIELHAGSVAVSSAGAGRGTTFTVRLPHETAIDSHDKTTGPLLLEGVKVLSRLEGPDATSMVDFLRASGAVVDSAASASPVDSDSANVVLSGRTDGTLLMQLPNGTAATETFLKPGTTAAEIVRNIARILATTAPVEKPTVSSESVNHPPR
jgi:signal transduction histidine kinase